MGKRSAGWLAGLLVLAGCSVQVRHGDQAPAPRSTREATAGAQQLLAHGAAAWNAGDLDGFVSDYAADATFVTSRGVVHGREAIRALYAPRFGPGALRDSLHFESLEVDALGPAALHAVAFYVLMRGDSVTSRGPTSLVMRRIDGAWKIVHDHSS